LIVVVFFSIANANELKLKGKLIFDSYEGFQVIYLDKIETWSNPEEIQTKNLPITNPEWLNDGKSVICDYDNLKCITTIDLNNLNMVYWDKPNVDMLPNNYQDKFIKPQISPNDEYLAMCVVENNSGYRIAVYDRTSNSFKICNEQYCQNRRFSWSQDSSKIAFETRDREVALYDLINNVTTIIVKGQSPIINPKNDEIYYVGWDDKLYVISVDDRTPKRISRRNWGWMSPIGFSKDGRFLYYTDAATVFLLEKEAIYAYDLELNKRHRISSKYSGIVGGSLFEE